MDNISEMEVFVRVVQAKSFSGAARNLGLSPSAVSKQIGRLEDRLGARLLNRTTRQLSLTEVGSAFFQRSERIITDVSEAELAVSHLHGAPRGTLRVNAPVSYGLRHIAPLIPEFLDAHNEVQLDLTVNDRFVDLVEEGVDVAIRIGELADSSLIARKLAPNRRLVCASPDYLAKHGTPKQPADLSDHNCMTYTYRAQRHEWHFDGPNGHEVVTVNGDMETNNAEVLHAGVLGHHGIVLLPLWLAGEDLCAGRLVELMPEYKVPDSAIYAVYPHNRHLSPKVRSFVDFLAEHLDRRTQDWEIKGC